MNWHLDPQTEDAAARYPFPIHQMEPESQVLGFKFNPAHSHWQRRVIHKAWPPGPLRSDPEQIILFFRNHHYLEALAMTVSWGGMSRARIYDGRDLQLIEEALQHCAQSIQDTHEASGAWMILTGDQPDHLGWSAVMASKTLHFLSRAVEPRDPSPPVPREGAVSLGYTWPGWIAQIPPAQRPQDWQGGTLDAYRRYMTAMVVWAAQRQWTTTQIETTIFHESQGQKKL